MNRSSRGDTFLLVVVMMLLSYLNSCVLSIELFMFQVHCSLQVQLSLSSWQNIGFFSIQTSSSILFEIF